MSTRDGRKVTPLAQDEGDDEGDDEGEATQAELLALLG